jgi:hypothetical protein
MNFETLNEMIPYVVGGKEKVLSMTPYEYVTLRMPGRHSQDTETPGGDFVVEITDDSTSWEQKQFTHQDIFEDFQDKTEVDAEVAEELMGIYANVVLGADPDDFFIPTSPLWDGTVMSWTLIPALQCLAVAEHRRYARYEAKMGGRFLPARFVAGIVYGQWTAEQAKSRVRMGRPGVEWLEKEAGVSYNKAWFQNAAQSLTVKTP